MSFELRMSARGTIELRDESALSGKAVLVVVHRGGNEQPIDRNPGKRIVFGEPQPAGQSQ